MVKDFKYIIKRILIGTGIALLLMLFKGNLAFDVQAKSCASTSGIAIKPADGYYNQTWSSSTGTDVQWAGRDFNAYRLTIPDNVDYLDITIPAVFTIHSETNQAQNFSIDLFSSGMAFALVNNYNSNTGVWTRGYYENGKFHTRIFKSIYTQNYIDITGFRLAAPPFYGNWNSLYVYAKLEEWWQVDYYECDSNADVKNAIDENTQAIEDTNDTLKDSSTDDPTSDINSMSSKVASNNSITRLLTLPITLYQNILNSVNGSCSTYNLGSLFGTNLTLPCINIESLIGSNLWGIIDILFSGLFILSFRKKMVDIFNNMSSLKDRGNELE